MVSARNHVRDRLEGHGIGKLLVPLVVHRQARTEMTKSHEALKERLESGAV